MPTNLNRFSKNRKAKLTVIIFFFIALIFVKQFYYIVEPGERGLVIRLWSMREPTYEPGFHIKAPFIERVIMMNIQTQKIERTADSASKDLQIVNSTIALNYNLDPNKVNRLYKNIWTEYVIESRIIEPAIQETVKAANAKFTAEELITKRQEVNIEMDKILQIKLEKVGIIVTDLNIVDYQFSDEFNIAIEQKVKAEQDALAEKNRLEKVKYQVQQKIESAKGNAEAILLEANAEAEAIRIKTNAIKAQWGKDYVSLKRVEKRDGILPKTSLWGDTPIIMNLEN